MNIIGVVVRYKGRELLKSKIGWLGLNSGVWWIVVVNNGSRDGSGGWLEEEEELRVIDEENVGG